MAILITGGAGFIGSHLTQILLKQSDAPLVSIDNFNDYYDPALKRENVKPVADNPRVTLVEGDFCDSDAMKRLFDEHEIDQVVHLGAMAGVRISVQKPEMYQHANVAGTLSLLEAARHHPVKRFLLASSSTVYGKGAGVPFREDAPLGIPSSPYGATKRAAELLCLTYHQLHGVPTACLRPFSVYGPRLRPDLALTIFAKAVHEGTPIPLFGDGSIRRDFTHVSDICQGFISALSADGVVGQELNLGHSDPIEMRRLIELLEKSFGKKAVIDYLPERPEDLPITYANLEKAEKLLGYGPKVRIEDGIQEYVDWFRSWHG